MNFISISSPALNANGVTVFSVDLRSDLGSSFEPRWWNRALELNTTHLLLRRTGFDSHSDFRMWESCRTMSLVGGFSRGYPVSPALPFRRCSIFSLASPAEALKTSMLRATLHPTHTRSIDPRYFQDDNARCHVSRATMQWYADNNVRRLDWPAQGPDLNPIEHLWDELDRRVRARQARPKSIAQLMEWLQEEWL
ncbi:hypothetical protein PR048_033671 [Dryococelus australis]|uniref:Tc1-like transposase DDE domain-containing protein n=1 Tax=Dryococelus australis TaxID=614101 RepID=A0ABQ9G255_9NEOP|nr:hypothetical protein PR048_033671 [Dryococelus australis]